MNVLQIKIYEDGTLECNPDFKIIRGGYKNILMNVEVPHSLLLDPVKDEINDNITGNFVRVAAIIRTIVGKTLQTQKYDLKVVKDFEHEGNMYRLYQRLMPKEFTLWETVNQLETYGNGQLQLIFNIVNWTTETTDVPRLHDTIIEQIVATPVLNLDVYSSGMLEDIDAIRNPMDYEIVKTRVGNVEMFLEKVNNDIKALQNNDRPYLYGWFNSISDLIANFPIATEDDYAYVIGGNIYEYHNNEWIDTGKKTPDNIAPLSDEDPNPVGDIASPGISSKAAKYDHVHKNSLQTEQNTINIAKNSADIAKNSADIAKNVADIAKKIDNSQIVQHTGQSMFNIMSQKSVSDLTDIIESKLNYLSDNHSICIRFDNISPASIFGGTWVLIKDRMLLGAGGKYEFGATGGSETHTLIVQEIPSHKHQVLHSHTATPSNTAVFASGGEIFASTQEYQLTRETGGNQPHNNMPPYLAVNIWVRDDDNTIGGII